MVRNVEPLTNPAAARYRARYDAARDGLPGAGRGWVSTLRDRAAEALSRQGFPATRVESWKYTDLRRMFREEFAEIGAGPMPDAAALAPLLVGDGPTAVFVDGVFAPALSRLGGLPSGASLGSLAAALGDGDAAVEAVLTASPALERPGLGALNTALMRDGALVRIDDGIEVPVPLGLLFVVTDGWAGEMHLRNVIALGAGAQATLVVRHAALGAAGGLIDIVSDVAVGDGARLDMLKLQEEGDEIVHIAQSLVRLGRDAALDGFTLNAGARLARTESCVRLDGTGADCTLNGLTLLRGRQHCDNSTDIDHAVPHGRSAQLYKNIVDDHARSVFLGRVHVAEGAQKTDAKQMNRNLLLSRGAQADSKPELIIHADDVKCGHGATVGDLDHNALFYLQTRGIPADEARGMLIEGFASEMLELIANESLRTAASDALGGWLARDAAERRAA